MPRLAVGVGGGSAEAIKTRFANANVAQIGQQSAIMRESSYFTPSMITRMSPSPGNPVVNLGSKSRFRLVWVVMLEKQFI